MSFFASLHGAQLDFFVWTFRFGQVQDPFRLARLPERLALMTRRPPLGACVAVELWFHVAVLRFDDPNPPRSCVAFVSGG